MLAVLGMIGELRTNIATGKVGKIDVSRLILGGVVSGVVLNVITGLANARIFNGDFQNWANGMGSHLHPPGPPIQICFWVLMCLIWASLPFCPVCGRALGFIRNNELYIYVESGGNRKASAWSLAIIEPRRVLAPRISRCLRFLIQLFDFGKIHPKGAAR